MLNRKEVLVVDDDPTIIELASLALSDEGYACVGARSGEEAIEKVKVSRPAMMLVDLTLPKMNGEHLVEWLRSNGYESIPVAVMTSGRLAGQKCPELGVDDCLAKPFDLADLRALIEKWAVVET